LKNVRYRQSSKRLRSAYQFLRLGALLGAGQQHPVRSFSAAPAVASEVISRFVPRQAREPSQNGLRIRSPDIVAQQRVLTLRGRMYSKQNSLGFVSGFQMTKPEESFILEIGYNPR